MGSTLQKISNSSGFLILLLTVLVVCVFKNHQDGKILCYMHFITIKNNFLNLYSHNHFQPFRIPSSGLCPQLRDQQSRHVVSLHKEEVVVLEFSREAEPIEDTDIDYIERERAVYDKELAYMSMESGKSKIRRTDVPVRRSSGRRILLLTGSPGFVPISPAMDWMRPIDIREGILLYSVYRFKCPSYLNIPSRKPRIMLDPRSGHPWPS